MRNMILTAKGGNASNVGVLNIYSSSPSINYSVISGSSQTVSGGTPTCHYTLGIVGTTNTELNASCGI